MDYLYILILLLVKLKCLKGELALKIFKYDNGIENAVSTDIKEYSGKNLTLICKLTSSNKENAFDDELSWGRKHRFLDFNTESDLSKLAKHKKHLFKFNKSNPNKATKQFLPLFPRDSGIYFCTSLKYKLFKIVKLETKPARPRLDYNFDLTGPPLLPKFMCLEDTFTCKSGTPCIHNEYVCDGIDDCQDHSDENVKLCGINACANKRPCSNGRCISESLCCNKFEDPNCTINIMHKCCFETKMLELAEMDNEKFQIMWIITPCVIVLVFIMVCVVLSRTKPKSRTSTALAQETMTAANFQVSMRNYDLPPSYEEAMRSTPIVNAF